MTVPTQTDKRFRRVGQPARRTRAATRRWWRVARTVAVAAGVVVGGYQAVELVVAAPFLVVRDIVVRGNDQLSEGEVLALMSGLRGEHILTLDLDAHRRRLVTSPWLRAGTLRRILPSTVEILVAERRPVALARFDGLLYLIDERGTVIDRHGPRFAEFDMPIIDGLGWSEASGTVVDSARMTLAARVLERLRSAPEVLAEVSQIDVTDPYDAVVLLNDDPALLHLGSDMFLERLRSYAELAPALRARVADIDYVDLRFDQRVFVKPVGEPGPATDGRGNQRVLASVR
jgi:cell division septal protein FtsQ